MRPGFGKAFWALAGLAVLVFALLVFYAAPRLSALTGGQMPFDLRILGYGPEDMRAYLAVASDGAADFYLSVMRPIDTVFPVLLTLIILWAHLVARGSRGFAYGLIALLYLFADLRENAAIGVILRAGEAGFEPDMALHAARMTVLKYAALGLSLVTLGRALALRKARL